MFDLCIESVLFRVTDNLTDHSHGHGEIVTRNVAGHHEVEVDVTFLVHVITHSPVLAPEIVGEKFGEAKM